MELTEGIRFYRKKPVRFVTDIIGATPEPYQAEIMESVRDNPMTTVRSGHGTGKTALESWVILWYLMTHSYPKIPCTAPTQHQLNDILWAEIAKWINSSPLRSEMVWTKEKVYLRGFDSTWFAVARTASNPNALQGFHGANLLFVIDEASGVKDTLFQPVLGALTEENARLLMCGNPTELSGFFFDSHNGQRDKYSCFVLNGAKSKRVSDQYVQTIIDMYGEDSDPYRVRVAGEFPKAMPDSFISVEWAEQCVRPSPHAPQVCIELGVDVARYGDDETVIQPVFDKTYAVKAVTLTKNDTMEVTGAVMQTIRWARGLAAVPVAVKIDCDGLGVGVYDRLREIRRSQNLFWLTLAECHFGGKGGRLRDDDPIEFENSTGLMWGAMRAKLKNRQITITGDQKLISQLANRKYRLNSEGRIVLERKEEMKKRGVHSPDRGDALALALYEPPKRLVRAGNIEFV